jgi:hypothetical protein
MSTVQCRPSNSRSSILLFEEPFHKPEVRIEHRTQSYSRSNYNVQDGEVFVSIASLSMLALYTNPVENLSPPKHVYWSWSTIVRINRWNSLILLAIETGQTRFFISRILNQVSAGRRAYSNAIAGSTGSTGSSTHWRSPVRRRFTVESLVQGSNLDITWYPVWHTPPGSTSSMLKLKVVYLVCPNQGS